MFCRPLGMVAYCGYSSRLSLSQHNGSRDAARRIIAHSPPKRRFLGTQRAPLENFRLFLNDLGDFAAGSNPVGDAKFRGGLWASSKLSVLWQGFEADPKRVQRTKSERMRAAARAAGCRRRSDSDGGDTNPVGDAKRTTRTLWLEPFSFVFISSVV